MKKTITLLLMLGIFLFAMQLIQAVTISTLESQIYMEKNKTYPLFLIPLDENVWNITLNILDGGNWTKFNFTWNGSIYQLNIIFTELGDYPFVINSTEVAGEIAGTFLIREAYNVTFKLYNRKKSYVFLSNKYINEMAYITAELPAGNRYYEPHIEPFFASVRDDRYIEPVWYAEYTNGVATLKLYEKGEHIIRFVDGEITFPNEYSVPNVTKSYGINAYLGIYSFNGSASYSLLVTSKDLYPYRWLLNWGLVIGICLVILISIVFLFVLPESPYFAVIFGIGFSFLLIVLRIILFIYWGM